MVDKRAMGNYRGIPNRLGIIIFLSFTLNLLFGQNHIAIINGIEVQAFCKQYHFRLKFKQNKRKLILAKGDYKITILPNSNLALVNNETIWYLKRPVSIQNGAIILPHSLTIKLLNLNLPKEAFVDNHLPQNSVTIEQPTYSSKKESIQFVVLDAGHGGKDPGNVHYKTPEKKITLIIAQKVEILLKRKMPNINIFMTRSRDEYISLENRSQKAINLTRLDHHGIFVSIHANASLSRTTKGIETYFFSSKPSKSSNERIQCISKLIKPMAINYTVQRILTQMYDLQFSHESKRLASYVNDELYKRVRSNTLNRGVKAHQPYFVITHNNLPSILVEVGFLSQPNEAVKLRNSSYQYKIAAGITKGISLFINEFNKTKGFTQ